MTPVSWAIFVCGVIGAYPVGKWLRNRPALQDHVWVLVGFLPFFSSLDMALVSFGRHPGDTHGFEVAVVDWLVLSLLFAQPRATRALPYRFALAAYLLIAVVAGLQARWPLAALGYVWKLCRMYLVFATVCRADNGWQVSAALLRGMMLGVCYQAGWAAWQHFGLRMYQATGTFPHQNTLGILQNLVIMVPIAYLLAGYTSLLTWLPPIAAVPTTIFTVSRGTMLFFAAGSVLVYFGSVFRRFTKRKIRIGVIGVVVAVGILPLALTALGSRSAEGNAYSLEIRSTYERAASMMLQDHPFGIGPNHFTVMLLAGGYGDRAGVEWSQRAAIVHNVYWLTAAEMGYAGLLALIVLLLTPLLSALRYSFRARQDSRGDVLLGLGVGLVLFSAHSLYEWAWRVTEVSYVYWMVVAIVATLSREIRDGLHTRNQLRKARSSATYRARAAVACELP